jgi:erythromycin esterase-like protein
MNKKMIQAIKDDAIPILETSDLNSLIDVLNDEKYVLLGESSHGTSEFYKVRAEISKKLIVDKGFTFLAVEGDWPACQQLNRYIKGYNQEETNLLKMLRSFNRWPTWMWANEELIDFIEWLKEYNQKQSDDQKVGFYGIDVYRIDRGNH